MKIVKRYELQIEPEQKIKVPFNSEILSVQIMNNRPALYILVDNDDKPMERTFVIVANNKDVPQHINGTHYVGSFEYQEEIGKHLLHCFEAR